MESGGTIVTTSYKWKFKAGMRARSYSWHGSKKAIARLKSAVSEIKAVAKSDPVAAGEGCVSLMERIWPAFEQIDTSSGALGSAVARTLEDLLPLLISAPAEQKVRARWLERLYQAILDDGVQYLYPVEQRFGEVAIYRDLMSGYADQLLPMLREAWVQQDRYIHVAGTAVCLSCLLEAERYDELQDLLRLKSDRHWNWQCFGAEAFLRQGKPEAALERAERVRTAQIQSHDHQQIDRFCEGVLIAAERRDEAYRLYGLRSAGAATFLATYRSVVNTYPERDKRQVLLDLIEVRGDKGKWFAAAKDSGFLDIALDCAAQRGVEPETLVRAARDFRDKEPRFAATVALQAISHLFAGYGYEPRLSMAEDAARYLHDAAVLLGKIGWARQTLESLVLGDCANDREMFRQSVKRIMPMFDE